MSKHMYLDETILQSRTTQTLVEFIDEMWELIDEGTLELEYMNPEDFMRIEKKYLEVKKKATKANKKRSFK